MGFEIAERLRKLPPYLFAEIDKRKKQAVSEGRDIINMGIGDPDQPTPQFIIDELARAVADPENHHYALDQGLPQLRAAFADWFERRFSVQLDPNAAIWPLIGTKEGIAHLPLAFVNPGDVALIPEPCYPPYRSGTLFAGGEPFYLPLRAERSFLPDLGSVPDDIARRAKLLYLNSPNNPTASVADLDFLGTVVDFARQHNIIVAQDAAYSELYYEEPPHSILEVEGAEEVAVEFHSLSKTFNMTGWRVGFAVGAPDIVKALGTVKSNVDSGIFQALQVASIAALTDTSDFCLRMRALYRDRRDTLVEGLRARGHDVASPRATFYVWARTPKSYGSSDFCTLLLDKADIVATPGVGFGPSGEGYVRFALTIDTSRIAEAMDRLTKLPL